MSFVRKVQEFGRHAHAPQRRERLIALRQIDPVVQLRVDDEHRRLPVLHGIERRPLLVERAVLVRRAAELPVGEPQLLGAPRHTDGVEHAVVVDERLEAVGVAGDPIDHVPAVRGARGAHPRRVHVRQPGDLVEPFHHVFVGIVAPVPGDRVGELLPVPGRAVEVDRSDDVAARREQLVVPAAAPVVGPGALGAAVNQVDDGILLRRIERRRFLDPTEHRIALGAHEAVLGQRRQVEAGERGIVLVRQRLAERPHLRRLGVALMQVHERLAVGGDVHVRIDATTGEHDGPTERRHVDAINVVASPLFDDGIDALGVGAPRVGAHRQAPSRRCFNCPTVRLSDRPSSHHQPQPVRLEARPLHRQPREPLTVGRVARCVVGALVVGRDRVQPTAVGSHQVDIDVGVVGDDRIAVHRDGDLAPVGRHGHVAVAAGGDRRHVVIHRRQVFGLAARQIHAEHVLAPAGTELVPVAPQQLGPQAGVGGIVPVAAVDLLLRRPFHVAHDEEALPVRQPGQLPGPLRQVADPPRLPARHIQHPHLRPVLTGREEGERLPVRRPARAAVRARSLRELAVRARRHLREPDPGDVAVVGERRRGHRVRHPAPVGRELRVAHRLHGDEVLERDRALLGRERTGQKGKGREHEQPDGVAIHAWPFCQTVRRSDCPTVRSPGGS